MATQPEDLSQETVSSSHASSSTRPDAQPTLAPQASPTTERRSAQTNRNENTRIGPSTVPLQSVPETASGSTAAMPVSSIDLAMILGTLRKSNNPEGWIITAQSFMEMRKFRHAIDILLDYYKGETSILEFSSH